MAEAMTNGLMANHLPNTPVANGPSNGMSSEHKKSDHHSSSSHKHSSSKDKHKHSSSHHHSSSSSKHHSTKHKDGSSSHSKHHNSSSSSSKHHSSSSSSKDPSKHHSSSDASKHHHSSSSSGSKDPSKSHSSSSSKHSSSKHKDGSSSHHSSKSSSKHKDGSSSHSSSKHKDGSSSHSSSKHKDGSSSHSSSKHKDGSSSKHHSSSSSKSHSKSDTSEMGSPRPPKPMSPEVNMKVKEERLSPIKIKTDPNSPLKMKIKHEPVAAESDDDVPLSSRVDTHSAPPKRIAHSPVKRAYLESDEDDVPLSKKAEKVKKIKKEEGHKKRKAEDDDFQPATKKKKKEKKDVKPVTKKEKAGAKVKKEGEEDNTKWRWWEEEKADTDLKWTFLEHGGPLLAPPYEPLPSNVRLYYNGKVMKLTEPTEEVATFYGRMLDHDYTTKEVFNRNFFKDWRKVMTQEEQGKITDLSKCDFREILTHFKEQTEIRKAMSKEEKQVIKKQNEGLVEQYGWCLIDKYKQRIGNFRIEPPGLFRGRGDHPKQGMLKKRTMPEHVTINCSRNSKIPQPPSGRRWKEVRHDNKVTWLACWNENIQNSTKYVMLNAASKLKGEKDWKKYETARTLHKCAHKIRVQYQDDWKSKEMRIRQRAVAMYFIDKLALRAGNEKDEDQADTVGCCSLRVEHINLHEKLGDKEYVVEFDFLGKDSIRYFNQVPVEKRVFKNLQLFKDNKSEGDDLFDRLNTSILNKHLQGLMEGLTAKVFRTYNASKTLQEQLDLLTKGDDNIPAKILSYNRANRAVAVLCNHQRAAPKNFSKQMENLQGRIDAKKDAIQDAKRDVKQAKADLKALRSENAKKLHDRKKKAVERLSEQLIKLEVQATDKDENKEIALGTSKLNYLDPRISVAWCKKWDVSVEKIYNKTQRDKFAWAIDMAEADFVF